MEIKDPRQFVDILEQAATLNRLDCYRAGHLLNLPNYGQAVMTGDLHGCVDNFNRLVWLASLDRSPDRHVIIHELIHSNGSHGSDIPDGLTEDCSCALLLRAAQWKIDFPEQVHFMLGNHDLAQITSREISKGGAASIANFNRWITSRFSETDAAAIIERVGDFLASLPLAIRCPNRIWLSHSLPSPAAMDYFDFSIFDREWQAGDLVPRGSIYELVWGRDLSPAHLKDLADMLNVDFFIIGHQRQELGYETQSDRAIILASDHCQGCYIPIDLSRKYTFPALAGRIKCFSDLPDISVGSR